MGLVTVAQFLSVLPAGTVTFTVMVIGGSGPGGTGWMLASQVQVTVAGGFAPVTEQFHKLPPWATLTTCSPGGKASVTVVTPSHGPLPRLVTVMV